MKQRRVEGAEKKEELEAERRTKGASGGRRDREGKSGWTGQEERHACLQQLIFTTMRRI